MKKKTSDRKAFLIIGLGYFGTKLALKLRDLDNDVMVVDANPSRVEEVSDLFEDIYCADMTRENVVAKMGVEKYDACFVAIGTNFKSSLEVSALLKEFNAQYIVAKTCNDIQSKLLLKLGVDELVFPESDIAENLAIMKNADSVRECIALDSVYALYSVAVPSAWYGKTVVELDVRRKYDINVVAVQAADGELHLAVANRTLQEGDNVKILGRQDEIAMVSKVIADASKQ